MRGLLKSYATLLFSVMTTLFLSNKNIISLLYFSMKEWLVRIQNARVFLDDVDFLTMCSVIAFLRSELHLLRWILYCSKFVYMRSLANFRHNFFDVYLPYNIVHSYLRFDSPFFWKIKSVKNYFHSGLFNGQVLISPVSAELLFFFFWLGISW